MVKGVNRQVIVVKSPDTALFDQAIFLLREDALEKNGVGQRELLEEAQKIADSSMHKKPASKCRRISPLLWICAGAFPVGLAWLLTSML